MRDRELTARTKLAFGVGQVAESIQLNTFDFFLFFYYVQVLHLNPVLAGTATLLALVVDAIADSALFAWLAAFAIATRVSLTFFIVPYFAVGAELTENYRDRTSLVAYRTMFSFASAIALSAVSFWVFFRANAEYAQGQLNPDAYPLFGITFAAVVVCAILASAAGTHRYMDRWSPCSACSAFTCFRSTTFPGQATKQPSGRCGNAAGHANQRVLPDRITVSSS